MRLLVTRPLPDALETAKWLAALGHQVMVQPLLTVVLAKPPAALPEPVALVLTSRNAVRAIATWPQARGWLRAPVFATGPATALAATELGFVDVRQGAGVEASLTRVIREGIAPGTGSLIYPAGHDRAGALTEELAALGYGVRVVEAYRAEAAGRLGDEVRAALAADALDGVVLYSRRTAEVFRVLAAQAGLEDRLPAPAYYVLSEQVASALAGIDARVRWPQRPDEADLLKLIGPASR
jgi:uroporphyrinogen-III synthase